MLVQHPLEMVLVDDEQVIQTLSSIIHAGRRLPVLGQTISAFRNRRTCNWYPASVCLSGPVIVTCCPSGKFLEAAASLSYASSFALFQRLEGLGCVVPLDFVRRCQRG